MDTQSFECTKQTISLIELGLNVGVQKEWERDRKGERQGQTLETDHHQVLCSLTLDEWSLLCCLHTLWAHSWQRIIQAYSCSTQKRQNCNSFCWEKSVLFLALCWSFRSSWYENDKCLKFSVDASLYLPAIDCLYFCFSTSMRECDNLTKRFCLCAFPNIVCITARVF